MASWREVKEAAPELAAAVQARFEVHKIALLASLRRDGSPRICPVGPLFADELWISSMPDSRKADDLRRDGRFALHSGTIDPWAQEGDAKVGGRARFVDDEPTVEAFRAEVRARAEWVPDGPFPLFRVDVGEISFLSAATDHLLIEWWREGSGLHRVERR